MKKIKLNSKRLQLKKEKIANLTDEVKLSIFGGASAPTTTATCQTAICTQNTCHSKCDECEPPPTTADCPSFTNSLVICG